MWVHMAENGICVPPPVKRHCAGTAPRNSWTEWLMTVCDWRDGCTVPKRPSRRYRAQRLTTTPHSRHWSRRVGGAAVAAGPPATLRHHRPPSPLPIARRGVGRPPPAAGPLAAALGSCGRGRTGRRRGGGVSGTGSGPSPHPRVAAVRTPAIDTTSTASAAAGGRCDRGRATTVLATGGSGGRRRTPLVVAARCGSAAAAANAATAAAAAAAARRDRHREQVAVAAAAAAASVAAGAAATDEPPPSGGGWPAAGTHRHAVAGGGCRRAAAARSLPRCWQPRAARLVPVLRPVPGGRASMAGGVGRRGTRCLWSGGEVPRQRPPGSGGGGPRPGPETACRAEVGGRSLVVGHAPRPSARTRRRPKPWQGAGATTEPLAMRHRIVVDGHATASQVNQKKKKTNSQLTPPKKGLRHLRLGAAWPTPPPPLRGSPSRPPRGLRPRQPTKP